VGFNDLLATQFRLNGVGFFAWSTKCELNIVHANLKCGDRHFVSPQSQKCPCPANRGKFDKWWNYNCTIVGSTRSSRGSLDSSIWVYGPAGWLIKTGCAVAAFEVKVWFCKIQAVNNFFAKITCNKMPKSCLSVLVWKRIKK
jgi:hypothetical protein